MQNALIEGQQREPISQRKGNKTRIWIFISDIKLIFLKKLHVFILQAKGEYYIVQRFDSISKQKSKK